MRLNCKRYVAVGTRRFVTSTVGSTAPDEDVPGVLGDLKRSVMGAIRHGFQLVGVRIAGIRVAIGTRIRVAIHVTVVVPITPYIL
jgi:hypothetical protein